MVHELTRLKAPSPLLLGLEGALAWRHLWHKASMLQLAYRPKHTRRVTGNKKGEMRENIVARGFNCIATPHLRCHLTTKATHTSTSTRAITRKNPAPSTTYSPPYSILLQVTHPTPHLATSAFPGAAFD